MTSATEQKIGAEKMAAVRPDIAASTLLVATILSGLFAGFFGTYTFSVTRGLAEADDVTYVESFQAINNTIRNPWFALVFFGSAPATLFALIVARKTHRRGTPLLAAGLGLLILTMVITFAGNVPLNDSLGLVDASNQKAASEARIDFEDDWNMLNLARTTTSVLGFACIAVASQLRAKLQNP